MWLPSWTFYGVVPEADDSLINFTLTIRRSWHLNIRFLSFTRCVVQHLVVSGKFSLDPFQYWGIRLAPGGSSWFIGVMKLLYDLIVQFFSQTVLKGFSVTLMLQGCGCWYNRDVLVPLLCGASSGRLRYTCYLVCVCVKWSLDWAIWTSYKVV